jgi:hypothetical protein
MTDQEMGPATSAGSTRAAQQSYLVREQLLAKQSSLESMLNRFAPEAAADQIEQAVVEFEARTRDERERLLQASADEHTPEEIGLCEWYAARYDLLARMARSITERSLPSAFTGPHQESIRQAAGAWAYCILLRGHASKWRQIAGNRTIAPRGILHQVFKSAFEYKISDHILEVTVEGQRTETTVEALYSRTLLLERFASGNLSPQRLEILDNWLITWMSALWLCTQPPIDDATLLLSIDTSSEIHGLTRFEVGQSADFYLALSPLHYQLERAIQSFHRGVLFPGWGIGMAFRVEEHVGVIDFLERELMLLEQNVLVKSKRFSPQSDVMVDVYFGLESIAARGLVGQSANLAPQEIAKLVSPEYSDNDKPERLRVLDVSETGVGLALPAALAMSVAIDDLLAIRFGAGYPCALGTIVRKTIGAVGTERNATIVGVNFLSRCPLLARLKTAPVPGPRVTLNAILSAGSSPYGSADSLVVSDAVYKASPTLTITFGSGYANDASADGVETYHVRLGRVRRKGRGWRMVAFDVIEKT